MPLCLSPVIELFLERLHYTRAVFTGYDGSCISFADNAFTRAIEGAQRAACLDGRYSQKSKHDGELVHDEDCWIDDKACGC